MSSEQNLASPNPSQRPSGEPARDGVSRRSLRGGADPREMRRLAAAAFGGAGQGDGFHFGCPECGHAIVVDPGGAGTRIACPECGGRIEVPSVAPAGHGSGGGVTRPARLPGPRDRGATPEVPAMRESRQAHDDQHRLNPERKAKFVPLEGGVPQVYEDADYKGYAGPNQGPGWIRIVAGILGFLVLGAAIYAFLDHTKGKPKNPSESTEQQGLPPEVEAVMAFYEQFRAAMSSDARAEFVRHPEVTLPRIQKYYQLRGIDPPSPMLQPHTAASVTEGGIDFIRFEAQFKGRTVFAYFEKRPSGKFLVDWESLVGYSPDEWGLFAATVPSDAQEFRAFLSGDEYFGEEFPDQAKVSCARFHHLDGGHDLYGYVPRGSELEAQMTSLIKAAGSGSSSDVPCRVRVRFARPGKNNRQVHVESLTPGWIEPVETVPVVEEVPSPVPPKASRAEVPAPPDTEPSLEPSLEPEDAATPDSGPGSPGKAPGGAEEIPRALPPAANGGGSGRTEIIPPAIPLER